MAIRLPHPEWLKVLPPSGEQYSELKALMRSQGLTTVCEEAHCPNVAECWAGGTATFMLLGDTCTRGCRFCAVKSGRPAPIDPDEPIRVAESIATLGLSYIVLTSVDRDDLLDGGADHIAACVEAIKERDPQLLVEVLTPDFQGQAGAIARIAGSGADVLGQNIETVRRLTHPFRDPRSGYEQTLAVLKRYKELAPDRYTKSSIQVGIGESPVEVRQCLEDLRVAAVDIVTIGQYLQPSPRHYQLEEYVTPQRFAEYEQVARDLGFLYAAAGPFVRSSYRAGELFIEGRLRAERSRHKPGL